MGWLCSLGALLHPGPAALCYPSIPFGWFPFTLQSVSLWTPQHKAALVTGLLSCGLVWNSDLDFTSSVIVCKLLNSPEPYFPPKTGRVMA